MKWIVAGGLAALLLLIPATAPVAQEIEQEEAIGPGIGTPRVLDLKGKKTEAAARKKPAPQPVPTGSHQFKPGGPGGVETRSAAPGDRPVLVPVGAGGQTGASKGADAVPAGDGSGGSSLKLNIPRPPNRDLNPPAADPVSSPRGPTDTSSASELRKKAPRLKPGDRITIDFQQTELMEVIKWISDTLGLNFILSEKDIKGKVSIISPEPVTVDEMYLAFLAALNTNDLAVVRQGRYLKVVRSKEAAKHPVQTYADGEPVPDRDEIITYILRLRHVPIGDVDRVIKQLKGKDGESIPFEPGAALILTDTAANIGRLVDIVRQLDQPGESEQIHIVKIFHADAAQIATTITEIFGEKARKGKPAAAPPPAAKGKPVKAAAVSTGLIEESGTVVKKAITDERTNQILLIAPTSILPKVVELVHHLDQPIPGDGEIHIFYLENADAEEVAKTIQTLAQGRQTQQRNRPQGGGQAAAGAASPGASELFEGEVKITADKSTNSLIIVSSLKDFISLKRVIQQLDIKRRQVFVEAVIMEVSLSNDQDLGVALNAGTVIEVAGDKIPVFGATTLESMSSILLDYSSLMGLALGMQGPELAETAGLLGAGVSIPAFGVVMQALQTDSNVNVISTPHILTTDNEEAQIIVGSNVPFITGQARDAMNRPVLSIQRQDVALTLKVTPQINESDFVRLKVEQELTNVLSMSETLGPTTSKRAAKTVIVVKDDQPVVIGGLIKDSVSEGVAKVPLLGDIPLIGRLFQRRNTRKEKTNLLIFLTPHIIRDEEDFRRVFKQKLSERQEFIERFYGAEQEAFRERVDYNRKVGLLEAIRGGGEEERQAGRQQAESQDEILVTPAGERVIEITGERFGPAPAPEPVLDLPPPEPPSEGLPGTDPAAPAESAPADAVVPDATGGTESVPAPAPQTDPAPEPVPAIPPPPDDGQPDAAETAPVAEPPAGGAG